MKRIRVALVSESFYPVSDAPAVRLTSFARSMLKNSRFSLRVITSNRSNKGFENIKIEKNFFPPSNNKQANPIRALSELFYGFETLIRLFIGNHDIVVITSPPFLSLIVVSFYLTSFKRGKYIVDVRDYYPAVYFEAGVISTTSFLGKTLLRLEKRIYDNALFVSAATQGLTDEISKKTNNRVKLVRNGYDSFLFKTSKKKSNRFYVVFHGNLSKFQDVEGLIRLAETLEEQDPEIRMIVIGAGSKDYLFKDVNVSNLDYLGKMDYRDVAATISKSSLGISLRKEGIIGKTAFPVKIYEYLGVGIPTICAPKCEAGDFLEKNKVGFQFDTEDINGIAKKIIELKRDQGSYNDLITNILKIRDQFSREFIGENLVNSIVKEIEE